jgi:hypothetical protein
LKTLEKQLAAPDPRPSHPYLLCAWAQGSRQRRLEHYLKLGFGGAHTDSNQRLMYTSA